MKKTLYIIHGWTYTTVPWEKTRQQLKKEEIETVMLRVPGLTAPSEAVWTIEAYEQWLDDQLKDVTDPIILGHSNGGRILMNYLSHRSGRVKHLILLSSAGVYERPKAVSRKRAVFRAAAKALKPLKYIPLVRKGVYRVLGASDYERASKNMKATLHNMLESDQRLHPEKVRTPTTILWGQKDKVTPLGMGQKLHRLIKGSTLRVFPEWAHAPYITHPDELAQVIREVMDKV